MLKFSIKQWSAWDLSDTGELADYRHVYSGRPALNDVKPMVKRRMPPLAKAIHELSAGDERMPVVYASKNAELSRTLKIIRQFGGDISPAMFSMSVHNAIPGLLSVVDQDDSLYSVIDSMSGVVEMAVFEAVSLLDQHEFVKVVYFEETTTTEFLEKNRQPDLAVVLKMTLSTGNEFSLQSEASNESNSGLDYSNALIKDYLSLLQGDVNHITQRCARNSWLWKKY